MFAFLDGQAVDQWAASQGAAAELPRLVRRLIWATVESCDIAKLSFPAGADVTLSGFDGELELRRAHAWLPRGRSVWELSVQAGRGAKAAKDYAKRLEAVSEVERGQTAYVAVSARRWQDDRKQEWVRA